MGGPNLLRSQIVLSDKDGEIIAPIVQSGRQTPGDARDAAVPAAADDIKAIAEYLHSVLAQRGRQGRPPESATAPEKVLVGDVAAGQAYFAATCSSAIR